MRTRVGQSDPESAHPLLLTPQQAAAALALGQTKVYELLATGALPSIKIGAARRIPRDALESFVAAKRDEANR